VRSELDGAEKTLHIQMRKTLRDEKYKKVGLIAVAATETGGKNLPTCLSDGRRKGRQNQKEFAAETAAIAKRIKGSINQ
jgi:hypothetical protein